MTIKKILTTTGLVPFVGAFLLSCASGPQPKYEMISSKTVSGVSMKMVRRTLLDENGQPSADHQPDYGILDPSRRFHPCGQQECKDGDFQTAAASFAAYSKAEEGPSGGGGGSGGGGM